MKNYIFPLFLFLGISFLSCDNDSAIREKAAQTLPQPSPQMVLWLVFSTTFVQIIVREVEAQNKEIVQFVERPIYIIRHFMPMMLKTRLHRRLHLHLILRHLLNLHKTLREYGIIPVQKVAPEVLEQLLHVQAVVEC